MNSVVQAVNTHIVFHFANGSVYELPLKHDNNNSLTTYGTKISLKEGLYSRSSDNIVGNVIGNTFNIDLISKDKLLLPLNEDSTFYGYMNDTAYVDVTCDVVDEDNYPVPMGRYFVDTWEGGTSSGTSNEVNISCVDLLSKIRKISIDKLRLRRNITFNDYLKIVIDKLNSTLPSYMQILYTNDDLNIFKNSPYDWQMYFNNIDRDNIENLFNCIAKYTVSYIWIDRNRHIKTDHLLDDNEAESVCTLSGSTNLLNYGTQTGDIDKYSGVKVNYITSVSHNNQELKKLEDIQLYKGENVFNNEQLNSDKVWDIHTIEIKCKKGNATITSFIHYKNSIDFTVESTKKTKATITIYGDVVNENYNSIEKYKNDNIKDTLVTIDNKVLRSDIIPTYVDGLINLMSMKNSQIYAEGFINPRIKLGDMVMVQGSTMGLSDYYKITSLEYTLGTNYKCKATMIKVIETPRNVEDILAVHNQLLLTALSCDAVYAVEYPDISSTDNAICEDELATELTTLRNVLNE